MPSFTQILSCAAILLIAPFLARATPLDPDENLRPSAHVEAHAPLGVGRPVPNLTLTPLTGQPRSLSELVKDQRGLVIVMTSATCPMCIKYAPRIAALDNDLREKGIRFVYINASEADSTVDMSRQIQTYRISSPYIPDRTHDAARALAARTTTEVFLLDPALMLVYRGAVDDQYGLRTSLDAPRTTYLTDAISALLAGIHPRIRATWSPGCLLDPPAPAPANEQTTYTNSVAWIIADNCVSCHRPGGAAPFPLDTYESVSGRAAMIEAVIRSELMPPWHAAPSSPNMPSPWANDRALSEKDRSILLSWLASDRPRGDSALPLPPHPLSQTWTIGEPSVLITSSGFRLPPDGGLKYARLMIPFPNQEDTWFDAIEFRPVDANSIHHAFVWILAPGDTLPAPHAQPTNLQFLGSFSPTDNLIRFPSETARRISAGSIFLIDAYARPMGKEVISALRIALRQATKPKYQIRSLSVSAATPDSPSTAFTELTLPSNARILSFQPALRSRARSFTLDALLPDGTSTRLITAPHFDFRWQIRHELALPQSFPPTTRLRLQAIFTQDDPAARPDGQLRFSTKASDESLLLNVELLDPIVSD